MSAFEIAVVIALGLIVFALLGLWSVLEKCTRHLSNIADRLADIVRANNDRR